MQNSWYFKPHCMKVTRKKGGLAKDPENRFTGKEKAGYQTVTEFLNRDDTDSYNSQESFLSCNVNKKRANTPESNP
ncbi:MAG: hypothetical protein EA360_11780 [Balneolaceae bacterium]|nr:MAG: hypothetical protein EA360_11780 [Balneolaceae bacterium]